MILLKAARRAMLLTLAAVLLLVVSVAEAQRGTTLQSRTLAEPAKPGLAVSGPLHGYRLTSNGRVMVPSTWGSRSALAGRLRFSTRQNSSCRYDVAYAIRSVLAPIQDPAAYVAAALPAIGPRYVLDSGARPSRAFRVVRRPSVRGQVRLEALWSGVLTKRADVAPPGQAAWTVIHVTALSRRGDECHAGTWREALGPAIGDSLAVARTSMHFTKPR